MLEIPKATPPEVIDWLTRGIVARGMAKETVVTCDNEPLEPTTVTMYSPVVPLQESMEDPVVPKLTLVGVTVHVRPPLETLAVKPTIPVKPFSAVTSIIEVPATPVSTVTPVGLADNMKSGTPPTLKVTVAV